MILNWNSENKFLFFILKIGKNEGGQILFNQFPC